MRRIPDALGRFTSRETFLLNCVRDLEARVDRAEAVLRVTVPPDVCLGDSHVFKTIGADPAKTMGGGGCQCGHYPPSRAA